MDNISEARTEVESIVAAPPNTSTAIATSISQEPIFDGAERHQSYGDDDSGVNVSFFFFNFSTKFEFKWQKKRIYSKKINFQGFNDRKVVFIAEEHVSEENDSESAEIEKLHPMKLHRR